MGKILSFGELEIEMPHQSEMWLRIRGQSIYSALADQGQGRGQIAEESNHDH